MVEHVKVDTNVEVKENTKKSKTVDIVSALKELEKEFGLAGLKNIVKGIEEKKDIKDIVIYEKLIDKVDYIKMKTNFKPQRQGWMKKNSVYRISDVNGGKKLAKQLVSEGKAIPVESPTSVQSILNSAFAIEQKSKLANDEKKLTSDDLRAMAKERRG